MAMGEICMVSRDGGEENMEAAFREAYDASAEDHLEIGAKVRWATRGCKGVGLRLALEGIKATSQVLR